MTKKSLLLVLSAFVFGSVACSSSSSPDTTGGDGGGGGGGGGGKDICSLINQADVQALVVPTITGVTNVDGVVCQFANSSVGIKVEHYDHDTDKTSYNDLSLDGGGGSGADHPISGVGDEAYWNEVLQGESPPELIARKGNITCVIQSPPPPDTTCKTTNGNFADSDALAYVQLMAKVCNDVFSVDN